jgi:hypothetical protein
MKNKRFCKKINIVTVSAIALTLVLGFAVIVSANNGALVNFNSQYPGNSFAGSCNICHAGVPATNPYGAALKGAGGTGSTISSAQFTAVEGVDSDGDTFTNLQEITAGTFPGDPTDSPEAPAVIDSIVPAVGTLGTEFTITGSGLGAKKGKIVVSNDLVSATLKIAKGAWTDTLITATLRKALPPGTYDVTVYLQPYATTSPILLPGAFTVNIPVLDPLTVGSGSPGTEIEIIGDFFGTKKGKVSIEGLYKGNPKTKKGKVTFWVMDANSGESQLRFLVPKGLDPGTYPLTVTNKVGASAVGTTFTITIP